MAWIVIVVAALVGAAWEGSFGAVALGVIAWLAQRLFALERRVAGLGPAAVVAPRPVPEGQPQPEAEPAREAEPAVDLPLDLAPTPALARAAVEPDRRPDTVPMPDPAPEPVPEPVGVREAEPLPGSAALDAVRGWFLGGNTIVKAGVGILFLGLAFLAKYATEHVSLPIELRLSGIGAVALVLLGIGWRLRASRPGYAQALQGGAVAVLYLTLFVAFRFYGVLAAGPVFAAMVVVAALAAALAVLQDARALAVIGALGGFATPLLVSTGSGNAVALFAYYLVLDLGIAAVAWFRTWRVLNLVGFTFTFLVATAWGVLRYRPQDYATGQGFLVAFFLLFVAILLMPARRADETPSRTDAWVEGSLLFGLPTIAFVLQYGLVRHTEFGVALSALVLAAFYVGLATWMRGRPRFALAFEGSLAVGVVFLTLVIPFALDARSTAGAWALEGAGLVWLGFRQARRLARGFGYALLVLAGFALAWAHERHGAPASVFDPLLFNGLLVAAAALAAGLFVHRHAGEGAERIAGPLAVAWATLWFAVVAVQEIDRFVLTAQVPAAILAASGAVALLYAALARRFDWPTAAQPVLLHALAMLLVTAVLVLDGARPFADGLWWGWPIAFGAQAAALAWASTHWPDRLRPVVHALGALIVAALGSLLGRQVTGGWGDAASAWPWLGWLALPAALLLALPREGMARVWPLRLDSAAYQGGAAGVLAAGALLWTLLANAVSDGTARPLPHLPFVNPLDVGIGLALVAAALWLRSPAGVATLPDRRVGLGLLAGGAFVWVNAILIRAFHHYGGVPYQVDAWMRSNAVQAGLTLLWSGLSLVAMWWAARRAVRPAWVAGAVLLGVVVVKLLIIDLAGSGTVARIVSFIGVGVLMLVIGYVAPLPKEERHAAS